MSQLQGVHRALLLQIAGKEGLLLPGQGFPQSLLPVVPGLPHQDILDSLPQLTEFVLHDVVVQALLIFVHSRPSLNIAYSILSL